METEFKISVGTRKRKYTPYPSSGHRSDLSREMEEVPFFGRSGGFLF